MVFSLVEVLDYSVLFVIIPVTRRLFIIEPPYDFSFFIAVMPERILDI